MKDVRERINDLEKWLTSAYDKIGIIQDADDYDINSPMSAEESLLWSLIDSYDRELTYAYAELAAYDEVNRTETAF